MYTLVIKPRSVLMAKDAYEWYEEQREGLGEEFLAELEFSYAKILKNPTKYDSSKTGLGASTSGVSLMLSYTKLQVLNSLFMQCSIQAEIRGTSSKIDFTNTKGLND